jgi:hypothetical protein
MPHHFGYSWEYPKISLTRQNVSATEEWVYFPPRTSNTLPPHILGTAEWYPIETEGYGTYHVREDFPDGRFEYQYCEFINDTWFITQWNQEHLAFRTC